MLDGNDSAYFATATGLSDHIGDTSDAHDASAISYAGGTGMSATNVEAAVDELATKKVDATRTISTTAPLTGGGDLSANRTLAVSAASETATGVLEIATAAEMTTGTDDVRAVTPLKMRSAGNARYVRTVNSTAPDGSGNVVVAGGYRTFTRVSGSDVGNARNPELRRCYRPYLCRYLGCPLQVRSYPRFRHQRDHLGRQVLHERADAYAWVVVRADTPGLGRGSLCADNQPSGRFRHGCGYGERNGGISQPRNPQGLLHLFGLRHGGGAVCLRGGDGQHADNQDW